MTDGIPPAAIEAAASICLRRYASEYSAGHLTWRDFADEAGEMLAAAVPLIRAEVETAVQRVFRTVYDEINALLEPELGGEEGGGGLASDVALALARREQRGRADERQRIRSGLLACTECGQGHRTTLGRYGHGYRPVFAAGSQVYGVPRDMLHVLDGDPAASDEDQERFPFADLIGEGDD
jgi:hypothetical protein